MNLFKKLFSTDKFLLIDVSDYLIQKIKSNIRRDVRCEYTSGNIQTIIHDEFECDLTPEQLFKVLKDCRNQLARSHINMHIDAMGIVCGRMR